ncbi:MAG: hypothetical protein AAF737_09385 [Pseudomonadota bacterium]
MNTMTPTGPFAPHEMSAIFEATHRQSDSSSQTDGTRSGRKSRRLANRALGFFSRR